MKPKSLLTIAFLFAVITGFAQYEEVQSSEEVLSQIKAVSSETHSISADYSETKTMMAFKEPQISKGKFYFQDPDKMRFAQNFPFPYVILVNGESLRISDNGKEKRIPKAGNMAAKANGFLLSLIKGEFDNKDVEVTCLQSNDFYKLVMVPQQKMMRQVYEEIELLFSKKDLRLDAILFKETSGDSKTMKFNNQEYNGSIDSSIFNTL